MNIHIYTKQTHSHRNKPVVTKAGGRGKVRGMRLTNANYYT